MQSGFQKGVCWLRQGSRSYWLACSHFLAHLYLPSAPNHGYITRQLSPWAAFSSPTFQDLWEWGVGGGEWVTNGVGDGKPLWPELEMPIKDQRDSKGFIR